jgi:hypothetical protein
MSRSIHDAMVGLKLNQKLQTRRLIIATLFRLGKGSSNEIREHITNKIRKTIIPSNAHIDERGLETLEHAEHQDDISLRTVQRHLVELCEEELVKKTGRLYTLADSVRANRFFGPKFGARVLYGLIGRPDYELKTVKQNLDYLIRLFGTIVTFSCMEAARPKSNFNVPGEGSKEEQLMSTMSWINSVISPSSLLHYFLFVFKNQIDDEMINKLTKLTFYGLKKGKHIWSDEKGKKYDDFPNAGMFPMFIDENNRPYNTGFYRDIPFLDEYLHMDRYTGVYTDFDAPLDEVKSQTYTRMINAFKELVPEFSSKLEELRTDEDHAEDFLEETR